MNTSRYEYSNDNCYQGDISSIIKTKGYDEISLISSSKYALFAPEEVPAYNWCWNTHTNFVEVGSSPAMYFDPVVRIWCLNSSCMGSMVIFTEEEWNKLTNMRLELCFKKFFEDKWFTETITEEVHPLGDAITVQFRNVINGRRTVEITNGSYTIGMSDIEFGKLFIWAPLIKRKMKLISAQNFIEFYNGFVSMVAESLRSNPCIDIIFFATMLCEHITSELHFIMQELLIFHPNMFMDDVKIAI